MRQKDLDAFLDASRMKFVGFPIHGDRDTLAGLPAPIHEGVKVLKQVTRILFKIHNKQSLILNFVNFNDNLFFL